MGAGKSTIGRQLARRLEMDFHDSDQTIEARTGVDISRIFDIEGEAGFRRREQQIIDELTRLQGVVLATGGGVILDPDNRARLRQRGLVDLPAGPMPISLLERTERDYPAAVTARGMTGTGRIRQLLAERDPLYTEVAHLIIDTDSLTVRRTVNNICRHLQSEASGHEKPAS
ncbi:MAG: shikimate kinase [Gammaproteobacteria bacterium]|nr:shikimate kinase [Gammaproteobacteria bacterium]